MNETCYKLHEDQPETCPGNCRIHGLVKETYPEKKARLKIELEVMHAEILAAGGRIIKLPKGYLSHSSITVRGKGEITESYRKQYYSDAPNYFATPSMDYGNIVTQAMEDKEEWVSFIPHLPIFERELFVNVNGVPVLMYIDTSNENNRFCEQKTTKTRWTENKINKHEQLDLYSLGLQLADGYVEDECSLVWVETDSPVVTKSMGLKKFTTVDDFKLTGKFEETPRTITQEMRDAMAAKVLRVALEIEEDFAAVAHMY
jgi:hypothetical protein